MFVKLYKHIEKSNFRFSGRRQLPNHLNIVSIYCGCDFWAAGGATNGIRASVRVTQKITVVQNQFLISPGCSSRRDESVAANGIENGGRMSLHEPLEVGECDARASVALEEEDEVGYTRHAPPRAAGGRRRVEHTASRAPTRGR